MPRASKTTRLDSDHKLVIVEEQRAWVTDKWSGDRVSVTWTREPGETLEAFTARCFDQGRKVVLFTSPAN
jgi:hypothetical protein